MQAQRCQEFVYRLHLSQVQADFGVLGYSIETTATRQLAQYTVGLDLYRGDTALALATVVLGWGVVAESASVGAPPQV